MHAQELFDAAQMVVSPQEENVLKKIKYFPQNDSSVIFRKFDYLRDRPVRVFQRQNRFYVPPVFPYTFSIDVSLERKSQLHKQRQTSVNK